jgi:DNA-binding MarR family transcriptional regulator
MNELRDESETACRGVDVVVSTPSPLNLAALGLREVILAGEQYRDVMSRHLGLTISESQAISYLFLRGPMGQSELGQALGLNTSSTTALVDRLERNVIAQRIPHPTDRRRSTVQLSAAGQETLSATTKWIVHAFDRIDSDALPELASTLHTLADGLRSRTDEIAAEPLALTQPIPRRRRRTR